MNIVLFDTLEDNNFIPVGSRVADHIINILKLKKGDSFRAGIWGKSRGLCHINRVDERGIEFTYTSNADAGKLLQVVMIISEVRPICARRLLRFIGESGIRAVIFSQTELADKNYHKSSLYSSGEYMDLLRQGCEISHSASKPEILFADSLKNALIMAQSYEPKHKIMLDSGENCPKLHKSDEEIALLCIGGERGFTEAERNYLLTNGFIQMTLGERILRSEEAAMLSVFPWL